MEMLSDIPAHIYANRAYFALGVATWVVAGLMTGFAVAAFNSAEAMMMDAKTESEYLKVGENPADLNKSTGWEIPLAVVFWPITIIGALLDIVRKPAIKT